MPGLYSQAKAELEREQAHKYAPEEILVLAKAVKAAADNAETSIQQLQVTAQKAAASVEAIPQFGDLVLALKSVASEFNDLKASIDALTIETRRKNMTETAAASKLVESLDESLYK